MNGYVAPGSKNRSSSTETEALLLLPRRGLLDLLLFLVISTVFFYLRNDDMLASLSGNVRQILGCPPPLTLITIAVISYSVSAALYGVGQIIDGARPVHRGTTLFYRTVFYFFYAVGNALPGYFMGVFVAGLLLYTLDQLHIWLYCLRIQPGAGSLLGKR